jgi:hypothetical protein
MLCCLGGTLSHHCFLYAGFETLAKHAQSGGLRLMLWHSRVSATAVTLLLFLGQLQMHAGLWPW